MKVRPGPSLLWLAGLATLLSAAAFVVAAAAWLVPVVAAAAVVLIVLDGIWLRRHAGELSVRRETPPVVGRDVPFDVLLHVAARGQVPELDLLRSNIAHSDAALAANDVTAYIDLVSEFHQLIVLGAGNRKLQAHYTTLMNQLAFPRLVSASLSVPGRFAKSEDEHRHMMDIIETKDGATAEQFMRHHVRASQEALLEAMPFSLRRGDGR